MVTQNTPPEPGRYVHPNEHKTVNEIRPKTHRLYSESPSQLTSISPSVVIGGAARQSPRHHRTPRVTGHSQSDAASSPICHRTYSTNHVYLHRPPVFRKCFPVLSVSSCCPRMILYGREGYRDGILYVYVYIAAFSLIYNMGEAYHMYILHL